MNLVPLGEAAVNGLSLKNVAFMSLGAIGCPAKAALVLRTETAIANDVARIETPKSRSMRNLVDQRTPLAQQLPFLPAGLT